MLKKLLNKLDPTREPSPKEIQDKQRKDSELAVAKLSIELVYVQHMLEYHKAQLKNLNT